MAEGGFPGTQTGPGNGGNGDRRDGKPGAGPNGGWYPTSSSAATVDAQGCPSHLPRTFGEGYGGCGHVFPADTGHGAGGGGYYGGGTGGGSGHSAGGGGGSGYVAHRVGQLPRLADGRCHRWVDSDGSMTVGGGPNAGAGQNGYAGKIIIYKRAAEECGLGSYGDPSVTCTQCPAVRGNTLQVCL